jgi:DtxR family Mn-dependent transcriptional regulator
MSAAARLPAAELSRLRVRDAGTNADHTAAVALVRQTGHIAMKALEEGATTLEMEKQIEEVLERLWTLRERDVMAPPGLAGETFDFEPAPAISEALRRGWLAVVHDGLELTPAGDKRAAGIIRRHRLAERLLFDVIHLDTDTMEAGACELEHSHILSEEATDRVCAFLGHPPTCPHGRPIPRGRCCEKFSQEVIPLVGPLSESTIGAAYRVVFIASRSHRRMDRLAAFGVVPGAALRLHQRLPTFMIQVGGTDIALEQEVAADIFVVPS